MGVFKNVEEYKEWINKQDWYQTINLKNGLITPGKFSTHSRIKYLEQIDFRNKRVLDIGCNSGQYCLMAKKLGAGEVVGVDIDEKRLRQAETLAQNEDLEITYIKKSLFELEDLGQFEIVLCIAVLTEITDFFGAVKVLRKIIGNYAFLELALARPILYMSHSKKWLRGNSHFSRRKAVTEVRQTKRGDWVISPSYEILQAMFGDKFRLQKKGSGIRYDMVEVFREK